jgi:hypothetical protein
VSAWEIAERTALGVALLLGVAAALIAATWGVWQLWEWVL